MSAARDPQVRTDLPYLTARRRPRRTADAAGASGAGPDLLRSYVAGRSATGRSRSGPAQDPAPRRDAASAGSAASTGPTSREPTGGSLDLGGSDLLRSYVAGRGASRGRGDAPAPPHGAVDHGGSSLDLDLSSRTAASTPPARQGGTSLDLDLRSTSAPAPGAPQEPRFPALDRVPEGIPVLGPGEHRILAYEEVPGSTRVVRLTRVQSGLGGLAVRALVPEHLAAVTFCAAYEMIGGHAGAVIGNGAQSGPDTGRPLITIGNHALTIDLAQTPGLRRVIVAVVVPVPRPEDVVPWDGTVTVETMGGGRIDIPLMPAPPGNIRALLSVNCVHGSLVLRAEHVGGTDGMRGIAHEFGYSALTWRDAFGPLQR